MHLIIIIIIIIIIITGNGKKTFVNDKYSHS